MIRFEVWASGSGSNAENLHYYFKNHPQIELASIMTNNPKAGVVARAERLGIDLRLIEWKDILSLNYLESLKQRKIDAVVLAGYLKLVPKDYIAQFEGRMINLHPSLLPKYGGKGMYGEKVHKAVLSAKEGYSGISIHLVNEHFDKGRILAQITTEIDSLETVGSLKAKIHRLEHKYFPMVVEDRLLNQV